jgi:hypothetical protein
MVIPVGDQALQFALVHRDQLFPGVEITYCALERRQIERKTLPAQVSGVLLTYDFDRTVDLALKLQPDVREAYCVFGTSDFDQQAGQTALAALGRHPQLRVHRLDETPYPVILEQLRHLPPASMVLYVSMLRDFAGETRFSPQVAAELSTASSVPVYGVAAHHLERGLLGGAMLDYAAHGRETAAMAVAKLNGQPLPAPINESSPLLLNWRALQKWQVPESRVPTEAIVRFKPLSLWQERRGMIIGIFAVVLMQSALIAGLLINRVTRRQAERELAEGRERMNLAADAANRHVGVGRLRR